MCPVAKVNQLYILGDPSRWHYHWTCWACIEEDEVLHEQELAAGALLKADDHESAADEPAAGEPAADQPAADQLDEAPDSDPYWYSSELREANALVETVQQELEQLMSAGPKVTVRGTSDFCRSVRWADMDQTACDHGAAVGQKSDVPLTVTQRNTTPLISTHADDGVDHTLRMSLERIMPHLDDSRTLRIAVDRMMRPDDDRMSGAADFEVVD